LYVDTVQFNERSLSLILEVVDRLTSLANFLTGYSIRGHIKGDWLIAGVKNLPVTKPNVKIDGPVSGYITWVRPASGVLGSGELREAQMNRWVARVSIG
jgi:hypothetical protein